ncbi:hypothetical protein CA13_46460 [Planctomycetes bacterium CA13]|uniref:Lipoprotein n=1 Tax=Novipirellula herctigrandis TaxID=2527986 RepID=A0A5C5Z9G6_9BACT|nr:hypothetical protein CA13_46460 [Planctomycetes bacterium CA13]
MKRLAIALLACLPFAVAGCSSSTPSNVAADASQEDLDNYQKWLDQAEGDLSGDEESGAFNEKKKR